MTEAFQVRDERKPGHHWADNEVLDLYGRRIGAYGYAVYMAMARHAGNESGRCLKTQGEIAEMLGISRDTVQRAIGKLVECRLAVKEEWPGQPCVYVLLAIPKQRFIPEGQLTTSSLLPPNLPLPAAGVETPDLPLTAAHLPPTAADLPLTAARNKERKLTSRLTSKPKLPPSADAEADPRHAAIRDLIREVHSKVNRLPEPLVPWDGREGGALARWLQNFPKATVEQVGVCIEHYYLSDVNISQRPARFIPHLLDYWLAPLNQYGTPRHFDKDFKNKQRSHSEATVGTN